MYGVCARQYPRLTAYQFFLHFDDGSNKNPLQDEHYLFVADFIDTPVSMESFEPIDVHESGFDFGIEGDAGL